jgi:hypothetical protein
MGPSTGGMSHDCAADAGAAPSHTIVATMSVTFAIG